MLNRQISIGAMIGTLVTIFTFGFSLLTTVVDILMLVGTIPGIALAFCLVGTVVVKKSWTSRLSATFAGLCAAALYALTLYFLGLSELMEPRLFGQDLPVLPLLAGCGALGGYCGHFGWTTPIVSED